MQVIRKFRGLISEFGFWNAVLYTLGLALRAICPRVFLYRYYIVAQPVPDGDLLPARRGKSIDVRELSQGDPAFRALPLDDDVLARRFAQNSICLAAFQDGKVIGCLWMCFDAYEEDEVRCIFRLDPPSQVSWDFDVYLHPDARLGFAFLRLWDAANALLRARGISWSLSRISGFNPGSMASHSRMGATRVGGLIAVKGPKRQLVFSSYTPFVSFRRLDRPLPEYAVSAPRNAETR